MKVTRCKCGDVIHPEDQVLVNMRSYDGDMEVTRAVCQDCAEKIVEMIL